LGYLTPAEFETAYWLQPKPVPVAGSPF